MRPPSSTQTAPCVLVTDAERGSALAIIRSLGAQGYRVIAASSRSGAIGFRSRFTRGRAVYPSPVSDPDGFCQAVLNVVRDERVDLLIPLTDSVILPLVAGRADLERHCEVALPDTPALQAAGDKDGMLARGKELGMTVPRSKVARDVDQAVTHARSIGWPVVLKAARSVRSQAGQWVRSTAVVYARDDAELRCRWSEVGGQGPTLVQQYCAGTGQGVELLMKDGRPLAAFQHERLREYPLHGGPSALRRSVALDPVMLEQSVALLASLNWTGLAMVEFKVGAEGPVLIEVNGRVWGSLPLAVRSGMDFPGLLANLFLGTPDPGTINTIYRIGHHQHSLELELKWIVTVLCGRRTDLFPPLPPRMAAVRALLQLLRPGWTYDVLHWGDPLPGLLLLPALLSRRSRKRAARAAVLE